MSQINIPKELLEKHSNQEIIAYLDSIMTGVLQNYKTSLEKGQPEVLWGNLGDISLVASMIRAIKKREDNLEAQRQS